MQATSKFPIEISELALDTTGSMANPDYPPTRLDAAREAALVFLKRKRVIDGRDRTGIVGFNEQAFQVSAFGRHPVEARADLAALNPDGNTSITAGLRMGLVLVHAEGKRFPGATLRCVLFSDGEHNHGPGPLEDGVVDDLERHGVIVDCVGIDQAGEGLLRQIAKRTGGLYVNCRNIQELIRRYEELAEKKTAPQQQGTRRWWPRLL
jgi:Mg-chelatase subunit ChlD